MKLKIYHNPRCRKSREALDLLNKKDIDLDIIKYMENPLSFEELKKLISILKIPAIEIVRTNEPTWKNNFKKLNLKEKDLIKVLIKNPKLIERPIIFSSNKGVIGRPIENLISFLKKNNF